MTRIWIERCEGDPNDIYPRNLRVISPYMRTDFPKRFTDAELIEHLSARCGSQLTRNILDPAGFLFGKVIYEVEK